MFVQASAQTKVTHGNTSLLVSILTSLTFFFFNGYILVLNICYVFCLAVTMVGHKHAILAVPIIVLLITPIMSESGSAWKGAAVFIVCKRDLFPAATRC